MSAETMRVVAADEIAGRHRDFAAFERQFVYPLGTDTFRIDHGTDYLAFFESLGDAVVWVAEREGKLLGVCVAVKRRFVEPVWYLCDLKVAESGRGLGLARRLLQQCRRTCLRDGEPVFGVSMNPSDGNNRMVRVVARFAAADVVEGPKLAIHSMQLVDWQRAREALERELGPIRFFDPTGTKDIVLGSTGRPMPLLHAQHGSCARANGGPAREGHVHMISLPVVDSLSGTLRDLGIEADATASVLHRGMATFDWRHLLTSDI